MKDDNEINKDNQQTEALPEKDDTGKAESKDPWTESEINPAQEKAAAENNPQEKKPEPASKWQRKDKSKQHLSKEDWERDLINRLAFSAINEQRRSRRWNVFFKSIFVLYFLGITLFYFQKDTREIHIGPHTALVEISGPIAEDAFSNANTIITGLRDAFKDRNTKAVMLKINSPGGSPVQAGYINDEIERLRKKYPNTPVYAVVSDICASAAYYIAAAADEIYADKASIVGSIGVLMDGFGFTDTLNKLGVERRLLTAGENKGFLDPFSPLKEEHKQHMQGLLNNVHDQFINVVKKGRGDRLKDHPGLFSGLIWSGEKSLELGLIDGMGNISSVAREVVGEEKIVDFTPRPDYLDRFAERIGVAAASSLSTWFMSQGALR